jgi:hypothetical protein
LIDKGAYIGSCEGVKLFKTHYPVVKLPARSDLDAEGRKSLVVFRDFVPSFISISNSDVFLGKQDLKVKSKCWS